jgi:putative membrane protein
MHQNWMLIKLGFVAVLLFYHGVCQKIMFDMINNKFKWTSNGLRIWNELATIFLIAIVLLVSVKNSMSWIYGIIGLLLLSGILLGAIKIYKLIRKK